MPQLNISAKTLGLTALPENIVPPRIKAGAEWMYERISRQIIEFEKRLNPDEEVGACLVSAAGQSPFHVEDLGFWGADMIIFKGRNADGRPVELIQHLHQVNVLLTALKKVDDQKKSIGFILFERLKGAGPQSAGE